MDESFDIPVFFGGEEQSFPAKLLVFGYSYKIQVNVKGQDVMFEPDEERNFRGVVEYDNLHQAKAIDVELLKAIAQSIEMVVK